MSVETERILTEICARYKKIRSGLAIGFSDNTVENYLREARGGIWISTPQEDELPFENDQFEVVVVDTKAVSRAIVHEVNRILIYGGCMFFAVNETSGSTPGYNAPEIYKLVREGFDILSVKKPNWWYFGLKGTAFTVCARKKAWREHKGFLHDGVHLFEPFVARTRK